MIATLHSSGLLNTSLGLTAALAVGFCLGLCLEKAGLGSSRRISGLLRLTDMTLAKVFLSALVTAALGMVAAQRTGLIALDALSLAPSNLLWQAIGGIIFGLGFALAGWGPATAAVGIASGRLDALAFLAGLVLGSIGFQEAFPWLAHLASLNGQEGTPGVAFLNQVLNVTTDQAVLALTGAVVVSFWVCEAVERGPAIARPGVSRLFLAIFSALLCLGSLVALNLPRPGHWGAQSVTVPPGATDRARTGDTPGQAGMQAAGPGSSGNPSGRLASGASPEEALLADAEAGKGRLEPGELARRLMAHDPDLTLVDLRSKSEFDAFHLPGALNLPASRLPEALSDRRGQGLIVLYAGDMTLPAQARDALGRLGFGNVDILGGGLREFFEQVLKPASLRGEPFSTDTAAGVQAARQFFLPAGLQRPVAPGLLSAPGSLPGLADTAWLKLNLNKPGLKVLDLRPWTQYAAGHIPGSLSLAPEGLRGDVGGVPSLLLPRQLLAGHMGLLGITPRDMVVLVSGGAPQESTLAALALERLGHTRYVLLQGGMAAWTASGLPTDKALPRVNATRYPSEKLPGAPEKSTEGFAVNGSEILTAMTDGKTVIIDASPADVYAGTGSGEERPGHIPGSVNRPFTQDQTSGPGDAAVFKPVNELEKAYAAIIASKNRPVIVVSRAVPEASQTWWILSRILGYADVRYCDAGWTEWSAHPEWPVVVSPAPAGQEKKP